MAWARRTWDLQDFTDDGLLGAVEFDTDPPLRVDQFMERTATEGLGACRTQLQADCPLRMDLDE